MNFRRFRSFLCLMAALLLAASCTNVKKADYHTPLIPPEDAHPAPIHFSGVKFDIPTGQDLGEIQAGGLGCGLNFIPVERHIITGAADGSDMRDVFRDTLKGEGYDITGSLDFGFPEELEMELLRAEYRVGATIKNVQVSGCMDTPNELFLGLGSDLATRIDGELYMEVEWTVYDALHRRTVYKTTQEGYTDLIYGNAEGLTLMITQAFEMAAHNLGADPAFHRLMFYGEKPPEGWRKKPREKWRDRPRQFDADEKVVIEHRPLSTVPLPKHADKTRKGAVLVGAGAGHGSGFFITKQGHIITNTHVVGDALRVRIVTADKEHALVAEVLRKEPVRDVALLKLEEIPEGFEIVTPPIRTDWPEVGETVYALGAPLSTRLQDTLTKGIVSAHRKDFKALGIKQDFIQADVAIHGGNSGGMLMDEYGNIIGQAVIGFGAGDGLNASLNLFNPVGDMLRRLDVERGE